MEEALTVSELAEFLQKLVTAGKGDYRIRSAEFECHTVTINDFDGIDDENMELWYTP